MPDRTDLALRRRPAWLGDLTAVGLGLLGAAVVTVDLYLYAVLLGHP